MSGTKKSMVARMRNFLSYRLIRDGKTIHATKTTTMIHPSKWAAFATIICFFSTTIAHPQGIPFAGSLKEVAKQAVSSESSPISESDITAAQQFGHSITVPEWLGPMAPVALSPFFGITCLSGMSLFGGNWISQTNPLLGDNSPLHNSAVFWTLLALTILTSIALWNVRLPAGCCSIVRFFEPSLPCGSVMSNVAKYFAVSSRTALRFRNLPCN